MRKHLPNLKAILQAYAVIAVMLSGWTIIAFLWKLSAWWLFLNLGEILTIFAYAMVANLVESMVVLGLLLLLCFLLPPRVLRDHFAMRGTILAMGLVGALMAFVGTHMQFGIEIGACLFLGPMAVLLVTIILLGISSRSDSVRTIELVVLWISDRLIVFLLILGPMFLISTLYVLYRNMT